MEKIVQLEKNPEGPTYVVEELETQGQETSKENDVENHMKDEVF